MPQVDAFVFNAHDTRSNDLANVAQVHQGPDSELGDAGAGVLNRLVENSQSDFLMFVDAENTPAVSRLEEMVAALADKTNSAMSMGLFDISCFLQDAWDRFESRAASLLAAPESGAAILLRRGVLEAIGNFRDVPSPIWDFAIRATSDGYSVEVVPGDHSPLDDAIDLTQLPSLVPGEPDRATNWLRQHLLEATPEDLVASPKSPADAIALKAGFLLWHDFLEESHQLSQSVEGQGRNRAGNYWHAILHRREPDYSNSKYWYRQVGRHSLFKSLAERADAILVESKAPDADEWRRRLRTPDDWDPLAFVDLCETCGSNGAAPLDEAARRIQRCEMELLLFQTLADARE